MSDESSARNAINGLNGADFLGKNLVVNEARPREIAPTTSAATAAVVTKKGDITATTTKK